MKKKKKKKDKKRDEDGEKVGSEEVAKRKEKTPPPPEPISAADVAAMASTAVEEAEQASLSQMKSDLGQYTGATLDGGTARLNKFARYSLT